MPKAIPLFFLALVLAVGFRPAAAQDSEPMRDLEAALQAAATDDILRQTDRTLDLVILGNGGVYSTSQAAHILQEFFREYPPSRLRLASGARNGTLKTASGLYWSNRLVEPVGVFARYRFSEGGWVLVALHVAAPGGLH